MIYKISPYFRSWKLMDLSWCLFLYSQCRSSWFVAVPGWKKGGNRNKIVCYLVVLLGSIVGCRRRIGGQFFGRQGSGTWLSWVCRSYSGGDLYLWSPRSGQKNCWICNESFIVELLSPKNKAINKTHGINKHLFIYLYLPCNKKRGNSWNACVFCPERPPR